MSGQHSLFTVRHISKVESLTSLLEPSHVLS